MNSSYNKMVSTFVSSLNSNTGAGGGGVRGGVKKVSIFSLAGEGKKNFPSSSRGGHTKSSKR